MKELYKLPARPEANRQNILQGDKYRITMLTEGLVRLEYSEDGIFEDRATQTVINRDFPPVEFQVKETEDELEILTWRFRLNYNKKEFNPRGLKAQVLGNTGFWNNVWHYGDELRDLKGTARTLDTVDGACELGHGLVSTEGFTAKIIKILQTFQIVQPVTPEINILNSFFAGCNPSFLGKNK